MSFGRPRRLSRVTAQFDIRTVAVEPGDTLPYEEGDWRDALVVVEQGEIVLQMLCGRSCFLQQGDTIWLAGLPLAGLHNRGDEPAVLVATARHTEMP
jgi:quercetin dioxygenase-like cupin family protein